MLAAEAGVRVGNGETATATGGGAMGATSGENDGISSLWFHIFLVEESDPARNLLGVRYPPPGWFLAKSAEATENKWDSILRTAKECANNKR